MPRETVWNLSLYPILMRSACNPMTSLRPKYYYLCNGVVIAA